MFLLWFWAPRGLFLVESSLMFNDLFDTIQLVDQN